MPLLNIVSNKSFSSLEKQDIAKEITNLMIETWRVLPDKIQVQILSVSDDEMYRGGVAPTNRAFLCLSRKISLDSNEYYKIPVKNLNIEKLLVVSIDTWTGVSFVDKSSLVKKITEYFVEKYKILGDNVVIYIREIIPENWFQNGISGRHPNFLNKSRNLE